MKRKNTNGRSRITGVGEYRLIGPDGKVKQSGQTHNLLTDFGDEWAAKRTAGITMGAVTGMRLGTGTTAPAKSGAGAAIVTYTSGSARALDGSFPTSTDKGAGLGYRATYQVTWPAGTVTANDLAEVAVTNITIADAAGSAGDTVARFLLDPAVNKGADDSLEVKWHNDYLGE